jgi:hypothetical protein
MDLAMEADEVPIEEVDVADMEGSSFGIIQGSSLFVSAATLLVLELLETLFPRRDRYLENFTASGSAPMSPTSSGRDIACNYSVASTHQLD